MRRSDGALKRATEPVKPRCPVIAMRGLRLGSIKSATNRSLSIPLGSAEVHAFARRGEDQFEIRCHRSQRHSKRMHKGFPQRTGSANLNNLCGTLWGEHWLRVGAFFWQTTAPSVLAMRKDAYQHLSATLNYSQRMDCKWTRTPGSISVLTFLLVLVMRRNDLWRCALGSDQATLLICKGYHPPNRHFEALNGHFHAPKCPCKISKMATLLH